ncbi:hypothetical protein M413DRAFT_442358 [Hebeloma cylindrosporum]|uniref:MYND-type domain-containing protein n=1 Tax=Hebeloma cylindrosporum TaxID=76867 RepID=A0A0C2Y7C5_HEBCY|nr:hypothetical protein M413DRAFT_442358 [Hebeloma cylindrosporum h7]
MQLDSPLIKCSTSEQISAHLDSLKKEENQALAEFNRGEFGAATSHYLRAAYIALGKSHKIPIEATRGGGGSQWQTYASLDAMSKLLLLRFYIGIGRCSLKMENLDEALMWLDEARCLVLSTRFALEIPLFEWIRYNLDLPDITKQIVTMLALTSDIFEMLGNTGTATDKRWNIGVESLDEQKHMTPEVQKIRNMGKLYELVSLRHPDPKLTATLKVEYPELQVLGSWKKVHVRKRGAMKPRLASASFIWNSKLYVGGGLGDSKGPLYRDLCCLDLNRLDTWRALPPYPASENMTGPWLCWNFVVYEDKAYLFTGQDKLDYFDLRTETWGSVMTSSLAKAAGSRHLVPLHTFKRSTQQLVGHHLYVFGGSHKTCAIGCNIFLQLDLKTMKWRKLSGYLKPGTAADYSCPGPRRNASSWVDPNEERIYLFGGECDRTAGEMTGELHTASSGYAYEDLWSWDIKNESWRLERLNGNVPCPRSEAACTYNRDLNKAVVFGGYNPAFATQFDSNFFPFAYFADTFIYCPDESAPTSHTAIAASNAPSFQSLRGKWKQVLTRGFPTYRAQSQLLTDPATGKMYLFGGYVNTDWVPSGKAGSSRTFCDVWQLSIDVPRGGFEDVDVFEEAKTAKVGPWHRCFGCGSAGRWKKCGGSCNGRAFFCDTECLQEGWRQHKRMHHCRKLT